MIVAGLFTFHIHVLSIVNETMDTKSNKIVLGGTTIVRFGATQPIELYQDGDLLQLVFNRTLGNLNIVITKSNGSVAYQHTVNAVEGSTFTISTSGWGTGNYTIRITDSDGDTKEGVFEIG